MHDVTVFFMGTTMRQRLEPEEWKECGDESKGPPMTRPRGRSTNDPSVTFDNFDRQMYTMQMHSGLTTMSTPEGPRDEQNISRILQQQMTSQMGDQLARGNTADAMEVARMMALPNPVMDKALGRPPRPPPGTGGNAAGDGTPCAMQ